MAIYLKYEGVDGDVTEDKHKKWIDISSLQFGIGRSIQTPTGASENRESSHPSVSEVVVTKTMDTASSKLFTESLTGEGKKVEIHLVSTSKNVSNVYAEYTLTNSMISGYSISSGGDRPSESISINFTKIEYKVTPLGLNNEPGTPVAVSYDLSTAKAG